MAGRIFRNVGNTTREIKNYTSNIQDDIFPMLEKYGITMSKKPFTMDKVTVGYMGDSYKDDYIKLYFNCIHQELETSEDMNSTSVFASIAYNGTYFKAGVIDVKKPAEAAEILYGALYEEGYRTDEESRKQQEEDKQKQQEEYKQKQEELARKKEEIRQYAKDNEEQENTEEMSDDEIEYLSQVQESSKDFDRLFDIYLRKLNETNDINGKIVASIMIMNEDGSGQFLGVDMFYVTGNNCLVQTNKINPKIDQVSTWAKAKEYCLKVAKKLNGVMSIYAFDSKDKEIELTPEEISGESDGTVSDGIDTGISL